MDSALTTVCLNPFILNLLESSELEINCLKKDFMFSFLSFD